ncbi:MAG: penicillin-binding protein 2 [Ruminococcus sp.]|nr:penicillin-binding protein 2 [Ruminococcus sp.]
MRRRGEHGVIVLTALFFVAFVGISLNYYRLAREQRYVEAAAAGSVVTVIAGESEGTIYDREMRPLTNAGTRFTAVAVPSALDREATAVYALDRSRFYTDFDCGEPFVFDCRADTPESDGLTVFELPVRYSGDMCAQHIIGYISQGEGVSGVEYAYDRILRTPSGVSSVTYTADGFGRVLIGGGKSIVRSKAANGGVVLTIDEEIQRICESAGRDIERGAIVVTNVRNGDILALASFPDYDPADISSALTDERCPLINRALYSYSVGSIFKLVTACAAIDQGCGGFVSRCGGSIAVGEQVFNCHKLDGHGVQTMEQAMTNSCNTYFIELSKCLDVAEFRECAYSLGFGREMYLCAGIAASAGVLPTVNELLVPAELANFSFGQGKLSATPLQINQLTCAIANGGKMPVLRLIQGISPDGESVPNEKPAQFSEVMSAETAVQLRDMMISAVADNPRSNAAPKNVAVGAKTSTAQTGRFGGDGEELCHAWITGFFPAEEPRYAVTVLIEDGGYGNDSAAPVFREIAGKISSAG